MEEILLYFSLKYDGDFHKILKALQTKEKVNQEDIIKTVHSIHSQYTTIISDDYPEQLKEISCPPFVLYYHGCLDVLKGKCIGVVGQRKPTDYGVSATQEIVRDLVKNDYVIISGMAKGIDAIAHETAIVNQGHTVAVLGSGINYCYPETNCALYDTLKQNQLIISEYPEQLSPKRYYFPNRNRIIAGLSASILVSEAHQKSGTMITVGYALDQGKDVFCIPSRINDPRGCNTLIQQGAKLVLDVHDIIEDSEMRLTK